MDAVIKKCVAAGFAAAWVAFASAETATGLEAYGDLTLVDSVDCATDSAHEFHEYPENASSVTTVLGVDCRVMPHQDGTAAYFSYRLGAGKNLVPGDMYLLVAEYPDDLPRTMTLLNRAMDSRNGFHTGRTIGDTLNAHIISQTHCESLEVPLSGAYKRLEQLMVLNENVYPYDSTDSKEFLNSATEGFDVIFQLFAKADAPDSAGAAIKSIRLYHVNNEAALAATINYPRDAPRRYVTFREEMADDSGRSFNADCKLWIGNKVRLMKALGINCYSRDMLEFGYNQYWDITCGGKYSGWFNGTADYYSDEVDICGAAGIYMMPYYEYAGSRGPSGLGYSEYRKCVPLFDGINNSGHFNKFVQGANGASGANVDITDSAANEDLRKILESTIVRYKDKANFVGAWIRNRGSMPISFSDNTLGRFNDETGRRGDAAVTRTNILAAAKATAGDPDMSDSDVFRNLIQMNQQPDIYKEYREWWSGKRADFLADMQKYLATNGIENAKVFFSGCLDEAGLLGKLGSYYNEYDDFVAAQNGDEWKKCGATKTVKSIGAVGGYDYPKYFLDMDEWTWFPFEYNHAAPKGDPQAYTNRANVAICYPYNCIYTTIPSAAAEYRNATDDLFFSRHYCLFEGCGSDTREKNEKGETIDKPLNGYFTCDMDRADRACMLPELYAVAYQDPTTIGYMQGNQLARNFSGPVREFHENFLSLPAVKGTVLKGGGWGDGDVTIRKYEYGGDKYFAVINLSGEEVTCNCQQIGWVIGNATVYETVRGSAHQVRSTEFNVTLQPYQLLCFSTVKPGSTLWTVASSEIADRSAKVVATVTSLKDDETGTLSGVISASSDFANATALESKAVNAAGEFTWTLSGLTPVTTYYVKLVYTPNEGSSAEKTLSFTTLTPADWPSASELAADPVGVTNLTAVVAVDGLGEGAANATVTFELAKSEDMAGAIERSVVLTSAGEASVTFGALNSETEYFVRATVSNSLGNVVTLGPVAATTKKVSSAEPFTGRYAPGLMQVKYGCEKGKYPDFSVTLSSASEADLDRTPGVVMSETGGDYVNPLSGTKWSWVNNTTYAYFGEMWFEGGRTYNFFHCVDDGVAIELDGEWLTRQSSENVSGFNAGVTKVQKTYEASGWHPVRVFVYDWDGGKGYVEGKVGFKMGLGWNTNGCYEVKSDTAAKWSALVDPGDGSLLRTRTSEPELIRVTGVRQDGKRIMTTVATELYDDDCTLEISVSTAEGTRTVVKTIAPADRTAASVDVDTGHDVSGTAPLYVAAHLANSRTGYDFWTESVRFQPQDDTPRCKFGEIEAAVDRGGTNATIRTTVEDVFGEETAVELKVNGRTVKTWTDVKADDTLSFVADVSRGSTNVYAFVFTSGEVTVASDTGVFIATTYTDWFTVDLEHDEAYQEGADWAAVPADRGSWTASADAVSTLVRTEGVGRVDLGQAEGATAEPLLEYTPVSPSETGADAEVRGRAPVTPSSSLADLSAQGLCVALTFLEDGGRIVPYGAADGGWQPLTGGTALVKGSWVDYALYFDFMSEAAPRVRFEVGDWTSSWASATLAARRLSIVGFRGVGGFGSFRGAYYSLAAGEDGPVIELVVPEFVADGSALGFTGSAGTAGAKFSLTIANPVEGAYYTVFTATQLDGQFTAEEASSLFAGGEETYTLTVDADTPSKFAKIVISRSPFEKGALLP